MEMDLTLAARETAAARKAMIEEIDRCIQMLIDLKHRIETDSYGNPDRIT